MECVCVCGGGAEHKAGDGWELHESRYTAHTSLLRAGLLL